MTERYPGPHSYRASIDPRPDAPRPDPSPGSPSLAALGWSDRWLAHLGEYREGRPGRILRHDGHAVLVATDAGTVHVGLRPSVPALAVGDWIVVHDDTVAGLLPRASLLQRRDPSTGGSQPIAANVDIVGIVCGLDRPISRGRIQRFISLAWDAGARPLVILSKVDLVDSTVAVGDEVAGWDPDLEVVGVSSAANIGVDGLLRRCADTTLVLVGESGAGKSTLLNALAGRELADTREVRSGDRKGRHTTTSRQLHLLEGRVRLIDTPGVREVGVHAEVETIDDGFADIAELAAACRFADCGHDGEPGCAVRQAVLDGSLDDDRVVSWRELRREAAAAELRADPAASRRGDRRLARIYREAQRSKRDRR